MVHRGRQAAARSAMANGSQTTAFGTPNPGVAGGLVTGGVIRSTLGLDVCLQPTRSRLPARGRVRARLGWPNGSNHNGAIAADARGRAPGGRRGAPRAALPSAGTGALHPSSAARDAACLIEARP